MSFAKRNGLRLLGACAVVSVWAGNAFGQEAFVRSTWVTVKPGQGKVWEEYFRAVLLGAEKIHAPGTVIGYSVDAGDRLGTYILVRPFQKWGEVDAFIASPEVLEKAYGAEEGRRIFEKGAAAIESTEVWFFRTLTDFSRTAPEGTPARIVRLIRTEVDPSMASTYERFLASVKAAEDKLPKATPVLRRVSVHGPTTVYSSSFLFGSWAEIDDALGTEAVLTKAYGESVAKELIESSLRCVRNQASYVLSARPDLTRRTEPTTSEDQQ